MKDFQLSATGVVILITRNVIARGRGKWARYGAHLRTSPVQGPSWKGPEWRAPSPPRRNSGPRGRPVNRDVEQSYSANTPPRRSPREPVSSGDSSPPVVATRPLMLTYGSSEKVRVETTGSMEEFRKVNEARWRALIANPSDTTDPELSRDLSKDGEGMESSQGRQSMDEELHGSTRASVEVEDLGVSTELVEGQALGSAFDRGKGKGVMKGGDEGKRCSREMVLYGCSDVASMGGRGGAVMHGRGGRGRRGEEAGVQDPSVGYRGRRSCMGMSLWGRRMVEARNVRELLERIMLLFL